MKLSKIILEKRKVVHQSEINLSENDINTLAGAISSKLDDYLDVENKELLNTTVKAAIEELTI
tara:strand:- start:117 stop:305 length:189 start_codon:yes stop_codon:yes gene_type:complete